MPRRRSFSAEFKTQLVLKLISGEQSAAELCREHRLKPQLLSEWKTAFLERAATVFQSDVRLEEAEVRWLTWNGRSVAKRWSWWRQKKP